MTLNDAIKTRINELLQEQNITLTALCLNSNLTPSTVFAFIEGKSKCPKVITIKKLCMGANITLQEFFNRDYFNDTTDLV
ncbi:MAG: helix-turn-helix transcriptional regulator [Clostridia bacterium]|nr:helix-turn-helix transcriptional regulator [Clostridia bacterium]